MATQEGKVGTLGRVRAMIQMLVMWKAVVPKLTNLCSLHTCHLGNAQWQSISMYSEIFLLPISFDEFIIECSFKNVSIMDLSSKL